jgi:hypothetical protein
MTCCLLRIVFATSEKRNSRYNRVGTNPMPHATSAAIAMDTADQGARCLSRTQIGTEGTASQQMSKRNGC